MVVYSFENTEIVEDYLQGFRKFIGYPSHAIYLSVHDICGGVQELPCTKDHLYIQTTAGRAKVRVSMMGIPSLLRTCAYVHNRQVTPEAFMKHIHTVDPDFFGCLSHQLANTSSLKQSSRAVDIALKWLDKCLELHCQHKVFVFLAILI